MKSQRIKIILRLVIIVMKRGREWLKCSGYSTCVCVCARITRQREREIELENIVMYITNFFGQVTKSWFKYQLS